jgi:hypothetical protein
MLGVPWATQGVLVAVGIEHCAREAARVQERIEAEGFEVTTVGEFPLGGLA